MRFSSYSRRQTTKQLKREWEEVYFVKLNIMYNETKNHQRQKEAEKWLEMIDESDPKFLWASDTTGRRWWFNNGPVATAFKLKFYRS